MLLHRQKAPSEEKTKYELIAWQILLIYFSFRTAGALAEETGDYLQTTVGPSTVILAWPHHHALIVARQLLQR
jgi:hypothetical protein